MPATVHRRQLTARASWNPRSRAFDPTASGVVEVVIDVEAIVAKFGKQALRDASGRAGALSGLIRARVLADVLTPAAH